jgi:hypothetical protein
MNSFRRLALSAAFCASLLGGYRAGLTQDRPLTWLWANLMPHGNDIFDIAYTNGLTVQVGERGRLYTSLDFETWIGRDTHTTKSLRGVCFLGNRIVVTGEEGTVLYGEASLRATFALLGLGTSDWLESVAASPRLAVAVGDRGAIYTSDTGTNWTRRPQSFSTWLRSVAYGSGTFVAVGETGFIATSTDGVNWRQRSSGVTEDLNRVAWLGNRYAAVGNSGRVLLSADSTASSWVNFSRANPPVGDLYTVAGEQTASSTVLMVGGQNELRLLQNLGASWSDQTDTLRHYPAPDWTYYCGFWNQSLFLLAGRSGMITEGFKTNGLSSYIWGTRSDPIRQWLWDLTEAGDLYVAVGDFATILTSNDGVDWDLEVPPNSVTNSIWLGVGGKPDLVVTVGSAGAIAVSTNSVIWNAVEPRPTTNDLQGVCAFGERLVVTGGKGSILTSLEGYHWNLETNIGPAFLSGVAAWSGGLVAVGENGALATSADGHTWALRTTGTTNWLYRVRHLGGQLVAVGENGAIFTSPDGMSWTPRASGTANWLNDVALLDGVYYAVGTQGTVLASADAIAWTNVGTITGKSLFAAVAVNHQLLTVGVEGLVLRAQPAPLAFLAYARSPGTNTYVISGQPGQRFALEESSDLHVWTNALALEFLDNTGRLIQQNPSEAAGKKFFRGRALP